MIWVARAVKASVRPPDSSAMPAVEVDHDPTRAEDDDYVEQKYREVQDSIQSGMDALARKRALPLFG